MSNKYTFINPNSPWKSRMKNELKVRIKYRLVIRWSENLRIVKRSIYKSAATVFLPQHSLLTSISLRYHNRISRLPKFPDISRVFPDIVPLSRLSTDVSRIPWHFPVSRNSRKVETMLLALHTNLNDVKSKLSTRHYTDTTMRGVKKKSDAT